MRGVSADPTPDAEAPASATRIPFLDVLVRLVLAALALCSAAASFGIVFDYARHERVPVFIAVMMGLLAGACGPCLGGIGQMLGEATYPRGLLLGFAAAAAFAAVVGGIEGSGWYVAAPMPLIATGATAVAIRPYKP